MCVITPVIKTSTIPWPSIVIDNIPQ